MPITAVCKQCGKSYNLADTTAGKKVKCKACGNVIQVPGAKKPAAQPMASGDFHEDDIGLVPIQADPVKRPAARAPAPQPSSPSANACPSCQMEMPPAGVVCVNCGYNRSIGQAMKVEVEAAPAQPPPRRPNFLDGLISSANDERDRYGFRLNNEYTNPGAATLDYAVPLLAPFVYVGYIIWNVVRAVMAFHDIPEAMHVPMSILIGGIVVLIVLGAVFFVTVPCAGALGASLAGRFMRFNLPEKVVSRSLAVVIVSALVFYLVAWALDFSGLGMEFLDEWRMSGRLFGVLLTAYFVATIIQFPLVWFLFRLKLIEAMVAELCFAIFTFIGSLLFLGASKFVLYLYFKMILESAARAAQHL